MPGWDLEDAVIERAHLVLAEGNGMKHALFIPPRRHACGK
jgi:hypothetical protein